MSQITTPPGTIRVFRLLYSQRLYCHCGHETSKIKLKLSSFQLEFTGRECCKLGRRCYLQLLRWSSKTEQKTVNILEILQQYKSRFVTSISHRKSWLCFTHVSYRCLFTILLLIGCRTARTVSYSSLLVVWCSTLPGSIK